MEYMYVYTYEKSVSLEFCKPESIPKAKRALKPRLIIKLFHIQFLHNQYLQFYKVKFPKSSPEGREKFLICKAPKSFNFLS